MGNSSQGFQPPFDNPAVRARVEQLAMTVIVPQLRAWLPDLSIDDARHFALEAAKEQVTTIGQLMLAQAHQPGTLFEITITKPKASLIHISGKDEAPPRIVAVGIAHMAEWRDRDPDLFFGALLGHALVQNPFLRAMLYAQGCTLSLRLTTASEELPAS